jgi:hypothetical protein
MRKTSAIYALLLFALLAACLGWWWHRWKQDGPRRDSIQALARLHAALESSDSAALLANLALPTALQTKTIPEQAEFVRKALRDEISPDGLALLAKQAQFGPLLELFPNEATNWAVQAGVSITNCVAFRLDRTNGFRAEVVLATQSAFREPHSANEYRILRVNNLAHTQPRP